MEAKDIIGLDIGQKHTGVARASSIAKLAEPLKTVSTKDLEAELSELSEQRGFEAIVAGLPRNLSGDDTKQTEWVRARIEHLKRAIKLPIYWQDEALTSKTAADHHDEHAQAAASILQDFLDAPESDRVLC